MKTSAPFLVCSRRTTLVEEDAEGQARVRGVHGFGQLREKPVRVRVDRHAELVEPSVEDIAGREAVGEHAPDEHAQQGRLPASADSREHLDVRRADAPVELLVIERARYVLLAEHAASLLYNFHYIGNYRSFA